MTNARARALRCAVLDSAEIAAVADLGKPFAAAKDTRVQAVILVRRRRPAARATRVFRGTTPLAEVAESDLREKAERGWQIYRHPVESRLCDGREGVSRPLAQVCEVGYGCAPATMPASSHGARRGPARSRCAAARTCCRTSFDSVPRPSST